MELNVLEKLGEAAGAAEKCIRELEEMLPIEKNRSALLEKMRNSSVNAAEAEKAGQQALALEKVLESMQERLERDIALLGRTIGELKGQYRQKSEKAGIGIIAEAVPE